MTSKNVNTKISLYYKTKKQKLKYKAADGVISRCFVNFITAQVVSTNTRRYPLTQGGLEIEIKVTVIWKNKKNLKILTEKVDSLQFTLGEFSIVNFENSR